MRISYKSMLLKRNSNIPQDEIENEKKQFQKKPWTESERNLQYI